MLSEEQQSLEKRVEQLRTACQNVSKKVQTCLSHQGKPADCDKRLVTFSIALLIIPLKEYSHIKVMKYEYLYNFAFY